MNLQKQPRMILQLRVEEHDDGVGEGKNEEPSRRQRAAQVNIDAPPEVVHHNGAGDVAVCDVRHARGEKRNRLEISDWRFQI